MAALVLIPVMLGATYYHIVYSVPSAIPAIVFTFMASYVMWRANNVAKWPLPFAHKGNS